MKVNISPSRAHGRVNAPPSKSFAHRMMICAALAGGTSVIDGVAESEDMLATLDCIRAMGAECSLSGQRLTVTGIAGRFGGKPEFPCRESGSTLRFLLPVALTAGCGGTFTGTERLMERGIGVYETLFAEKGIAVNKNGGITVGGALTPGEYTLPGNVSSQFVSGLLFALPLLGGDSTVRVLPPVESRAYIDITAAVETQFGVTITESEPNVFAVKGGQKFRATNAAVEGDWSNAAFLLALNHLGGSVEVSGLNPLSLQGDRVCAELLDRLESPGAQIDVSACPDLAPILFAVAAAKHGAHFTGTARLKIKESDRAAVMARELAKFGISSDIRENESFISGGLSAPNAELCGHNDHRIVMALSVLLSMTGGVIDGAEAIRKSYPDFFTTLAALGTEVKVI
jgi:3-phosphoshikimate 1-carboxyvinyltransferase